MKESEREREQEILRGGRREGGKERALQSTAVFSGMSPCYRWLVGGMEGSSENTLALHISDTNQLWSAASTHVHPSPLSVCRNKLLLYVRNAADAFNCQARAAVERLSRHLGVYLKLQHLCI